jgi:transcriptional regulator with XRE-family HTH domain
LKISALVRYLRAMDETQKRIAASARALAAAFQDKQVDLAGALGISQNAVSRKLNGMTQWSAADLRVLASRYDITVDQLMAGPRAWLGRKEGGTTPPYVPEMAAMAA